jgi:hypothetical protein
VSPLEHLNAWGCERLTVARDNGAPEAFDVLVRRAGCRRHRRGSLPCPNDDEPPGRWWRQVFRRRSTWIGGRERSAQCFGKERSFV